MDKIIQVLRTSQECEEVEKILTDLANQARRRAVELKALSHKPSNKLENDLFEALYAYEDILSYKHKRKTRAARTWQMVKKYGITETAERAVNRPFEALGFQNLQDRGLLDKSFEYVILKYPESFRPDTVRISQERLVGLLGKD